MAYVLGGLRNEQTKPSFDMILVEGFEDHPTIFEGENRVAKNAKSKWVWTDVGMAKSELVKIGEL